MTREETWLEERRRHVTATDLPAVMQFDDAYGSPMDVYLDKLGLMERGEEAERLAWGKRLQEAILAGYAERQGVALDLADPYAIVEVPGHPLVSASLDARWREDGRRPVDAKNVGFQGREWGEPGTDEIPPRFYVQLQIQMAATATDYADLAVLFGGNRLAVYTVPRDEGVIRGALEAAEEFWARHVVPRVPPPVDCSPAWTRYLAAVPQSSMEVAESTLLVDRWADALHRVQIQRAQLEAFEERAKNVIRQAISNRAGIQGPWGRASFRVTKDRETVAWKALAQDLARRLMDDGTMSPVEWETLLSRYASTKAGPRSLRITWAEDVEVMVDEASLVPLVGDLPALPPGPEQEAGAGATT